MQWLLALGARALILKLGAVGCFHASPDAAAYTRVPAFSVTARDTTAAGDVFNAALALALAEGVFLLAEGASMKQSMRFANAAAAVSVTRPGAQNSAPDRRDVSLMLAT